MIQDTSLWAHELASKDLGAKQKQVLDALRFFPDATNAEIAAHLKWPINRVTPRMGELRAQGLVLESGRRRCKVTGNTAHAWTAKHPVLPPAFEPRNEQTQTLL
jgi:DNA-binding MarR family transcriptional regulator